MTIRSNFMATKIDSQKVADILRDCAAKYILPRFKSLKQADIQTKSGPTDLVTIADIETEEALDRILSAEYPGTLVIGEESVSAGTKDLDVLQKKQGVVFVADPVDGTGNFVQGRTTFCVMLACVIDGVTEYGWIYDPLGNRMMIAGRGQGAEINGQKLKVASPKALAQSDGYAHPFFFPKRLRHHVDTLKQVSGSISSLRCSGHEYLRMAAGDIDFSVSARPRPWDHLAGTLAVKEAGGLALKWDGGPYTPQDELGGLVVVSHAGLFKELQAGFLNGLIRDYNNPPPKP